MLKNNKNQKGVSLIITLFIMIIILAVVISISTLLYSEIKVLRNVGNSVVGLYSADSGIEKVLYYDRQVVPTGAVRGLCSMFLSNACNSGSSGDPSIHCNSSILMPTRLTRTDDLGCAPANCDDCTVSFNTTLDSGSSLLPNDDTLYSTTARVYAEGDINKFEISSKGDFSGASRQIQIVVDTTASVAISNLTADCSEISADVTPEDNQYNVYAVISGTNSPLNLQSGGKNPWSKPWHPSAGTYTIHIEVYSRDNMYLGQSDSIDKTCP
jgi:hypothetical protein